MVKADNPAPGAADTDREAVPSYVFRPFALPLDWLDVLLTVPQGSPQERPYSNEDTIPLGDRLALVRQPGRSKAFDRLDALVDVRTDRTLGLVRSCPHSAAIMPMNRVQLKLANDALYNGTWSETLAHVQDGLGWAYHAVSKLDLAADGHGFLAPFADAARGAVSYGGRADFVVRYNGGKIKAAELGVKSSNKFGRIYGKSRELRLSGKLYIADYWKVNGCEDVDNVDRCEISVKGPEVRRYYPAERTRAFLDGLASPRYRAEVFASVANTFIRFRTGQAGDRSRDRVDLLSWAWDRIADQDHVDARPRAKRVQDLGLNALKAHVRLSYMMHVATGSPRYLSTAQEVAEAVGLSRWMAGKAPLWKRTAEKIVATGLRAATLFDMLQGCDDILDERLAEEARKLKEAEDAWKVRKRAAASNFAPNRKRK